MLDGRWCCGFRYSVVDFVEKNRDDLNQNLQDLVAASGSAFIRSQLFSPTLGEDSGATPVAPAGSAAASRQSKRTQVCGTRHVWDGRRASCLACLVCVCVCARACGDPAVFLLPLGVFLSQMSHPSVWKAHVCACLLLSRCLFVCLWLLLLLLLWGFFSAVGQVPWAAGPADAVLGAESAPLHSVHQAQRPEVPHGVPCPRLLEAAGVRWCASGGEDLPKGCVLPSPAFLALPRPMCIP